MILDAWGWCTGTTQRDGMGRVEEFILNKIKLKKKKLNIQKTKIMASGPITSWEIDGETVETVSDFILGGSKNHCRW